MARLGWEAARRGAPRHGAASHDTARKPAIRPGARATRRAVRLAGSKVAIQRFVSWLRGADLGSRYDGTALRYSTAAGHDTAQELRHGEQEL